MPGRIVTKQLATYDPGNSYGANYMWGTTGIGYNVKMVQKILGPDARIDSWDIVFKPENLAKFKDCGIHMLDSADDILPAALGYLGLDPNSTKQADLEKAADLVIKIRPYVRKFHSSEYLSALATGEICFVVGWSGDIMQARSRAAEAKNDIEIGYAIPKEGAQMFFDNLAIPADAKNVAEAYELINYLYRPEVAAKNSDFLSYANGNLASQKLVDPKILNDKNIYPDEATHGEAVRDHRARSRDPAHHQPAVDQGEDGKVAATSRNDAVATDVHRQRRCSHSHWSGYSRIQPSTTEVTACIVPWMSICPSASRTGLTSSDSSARKRWPGRRMMRTPWIGHSTCRNSRASIGLALVLRPKNVTSTPLVRYWSTSMATCWPVLQRLRELQRRVAAGRDQRAHLDRADILDGAVGGGDVGPAEQDRGVQPMRDRGERRQFPIAEMAGKDQRRLAVDP